MTSARRGSLTASGQLRTPGSWMSWPGGRSPSTCASTSNKALGVVPDTARHPLPALLAAGVGCSLGADDPLMFGAGLLDEYETARSELGLGDDQLAALARTSVQTSGAPASVIATATADVDAWLRTE